MLLWQFDWRIILFASQDNRFCLRIELQEAHEYIHAPTLFILDKFLIGKETRSYLNHLDELTLTFKEDKVCRERGFFSTSFFMVSIDVFKRWRRY